MRVAQFVLVILFVLTSPLNLSSQQSITPQRDTQALTTLGQMAAAAGWLPGSLPIAITSSGTLTHLDGDQQSEPFTLKQRGATQHRLDVVNSGGIATTVVNGLSGIIRFADATKHRLPAHAALSIQSPVFPFFSDVVKAADLDVEVQDLGTDTIDGVPVHGISIARHAKSGDKLGRFRDLAAPLKVWISQQSGLPVRIDFVRLADDNPYLQMHFSRSFSDYHVVSGVAIAFTQDERFEGQLFQRIQLTDVQFTSALTDADFDTSKL